MTPKKKDIEPTQSIIFTCEHGGNRVPGPLQPLFANAVEALATHQGWDPGALRMSRFLARELAAPLHAATISRLVVDLNRSPDNPQVVSDWTRRLSMKARGALIEQFHAPHRRDVEAAVEQGIANRGRILHVAVHSFATEVDGKTRSTDVGLLYDPSRSGEAAVADAWSEKLREALPNWTIHRNQPFRGVDDGLPTYLRGLHGDDAYLGFELEIRDERLQDGKDYTRLAKVLCENLRDLDERIGEF